MSNTKLTMGNLAAYVLLILGAIQFFVVVFENFLKPISTHDAIMGLGGTGILLLMAIFWRIDKCIT